METTERPVRGCLYDGAKSREERRFHIIGPLGLPLCEIELAEPLCTQALRTSGQWCSHCIEKERAHG